MTEELNGRRIVVPEARELGQLVRMLEERGAEAIPCPMIAIRDAPDAEPVAAWLRWFVKGTCNDLVLMTGEGLRRLLGLARRTDLDSAFLDALRTTRKITRGPKPVRALREVGLDADIPADEPTNQKTGKLEVDNVKVHKVPVQEDGVWTQAEDVAQIGKLTVRLGHVGEAAVNDWIAAMMSIYKQITGKNPGISVVAPSRPGRGKAAGPFIRFLEAVGKPLGIQSSPNSLAGRIKDIRTGGRRSQK
jgi:hypothetical protein